MIMGSQHTEPQDTIKARTALIDVLRSLQNPLYR